MMKRFIMILLLIGLCACQSGGNNDEKEITIRIYDDYHQKDVLDQSFKTNAETLEQFMREEEILKALIEDGAYGAYLVGLFDIEMQDGYYWVYESDNNETCVKMGMCPALKEVYLKDADIFLFKYTDTFN